MALPPGSPGGHYRRTYRVQTLDSKRRLTYNRISQPIMLYYIARRILNRQDQPTNNPEITNRLKGILAERDEDYEDAFESEEEDGYYSDDKTVRKVARPARRERDLALTSYEQSIASEVVQPSSIPVSFEDIGGMDDIISELQETVIYPLTLPSLYSKSSPLLSAPSGVLLYGPPGCGKTMLAKALARESNAVFINLHISTLTEKWYGDSNKLVSAVFSLARKLAPAIVFIDEIDAVLGTRRSGEHEASGMVKAEMMTHWDGLASMDSQGRPQQVLILGATNRPQDIDDAILRRMPKRFAVGLPDAEQRRRIFRLILRDTKLDDAPGAEPADGPAFDLDFLVQMSAGMSGSEIKEACREAAMAPMREFIQGRRARGETIKGSKGRDLRGLRTGDFFQNRNGGSRSVATDAAHRASQAKGGKVTEQAEDEEYETVDEEGSDVEEKTTLNGSAKKPAPRRRKSTPKSQTS